LFRSFRFGLAAAFLLICCWLWLSHFSQHPKDPVLYCSTKRLVMFLATLQLGTKQVRGTVQNGLENCFRERVSVACPGEINLSLIYTEFISSLPRLFGRPILVFSPFGNSKFYFWFSVVMNSKFITHLVYAQRATYAKDPLLVLIQASRFPSESHDAQHNCNVSFACCSGELSFGVATGNNTRA
jgi:hypothetical protein